MQVRRIWSWRPPAVALLALLLVFFTGGSGGTLTIPAAGVPPVSAPVPQAGVTSAAREESSLPPEERTVTGTLLSTGDLLMHDPILEAAYDAQEKAYDFRRIFTHIAPYVEKADVAVANLEVTLAGNERIPYRGYPRFN